MDFSYVPYDKLYFSKVWTSSENMWLCMNFDNFSLGKVMWDSKQKRYNFYPNDDVLYCSQSLLCIMDFLYKLDLALQPWR